MALGPRARVLLIAALVFAALGAFVWYLSYAYWSQPVTPLRPASPEAVETTATTPTPDANVSPGAAQPPGATPQTPAPAPSAEASETPGATPTPTQQPSPVATPQSQPPSRSLSQPQTQGGDVNSLLASMRLLIPVQGVRAEGLRDTFSDARSEGRVHDAIDIMAPRNAPVLAAADGRVVKLFRSVKGGITLYQLASADEHIVFYYAHLERYADGLAEGHFARRGETIGYVGDTGNAVPGNTHLHFQIYRVADPKHFWTGDNVNPYPLLRAAQ
jgi:murein DD-endopeptidase MepM/ murein hydrolase activator NlpD